MAQAIQARPALRTSTTMHDDVVYNSNSAPLPSAPSLFSGPAGLKNGLRKALDLAFLAAAASLGLIFVVRFVASAGDVMAPFR
jgi:hypothetical protein